MISSTLVQPVPHMHDMRWFVWTIVFLLVVGVSLVTYITYVNLTDESLNYTELQVRPARARAVAPSSSPQ